MKPTQRFRATAGKEPGELVLYMYDEIGASFWSDGVLAKDVAAAIEAATPSAITVRLNSPGGDVFEGHAIYSLLTSAGVPVKVMVDGLAASAASIIAMAGGEIVMGSSAMMMIHNAWMGAAGDAAYLRKQADILDKISGVMRDTYAARSGAAADEVQTMMDAETWMTAAEAVEHGFATSIYQPEEPDQAAAAAMVRGFRLDKRFRHVPDAIAEAASAAEPAETQAAEPAPASAAPDLSILERDLLALEMSALAL